MAAINLSTIVGGSAIKSVQRGQATWSGSTQLVNVTITAVVMAKSFVRMSFKTTSGDYSGVVTARLTTTTNLELSRGGNTSGTFTMDWEVIEYE